ncbi:Tn3 family transposase [Streptosporangium roseum]|uniref:Tn3 family transposase n=1 Tax=Streptosporangium roseum TaxID=2001 RepID=UPI003326182F
MRGGRGLSTYTHVSDQWSTYGTRQIVPTAREGRHILDELIGDATDLPITEHATGTRGATLVNFGLFDLVGKALTPRIRGKWSAASRQSTLAGPGILMSPFRSRRCGSPWRRRRGVAALPSPPPPSRCRSPPR